MLLPTKLQYRDANFFLEFQILFIWRASIRVSESQVTNFIPFTQQQSLNPFSKCFTTQNIDSKVDRRIENMNGRIKAGKRVEEMGTTSNCISILPHYGPSNWIEHITEYKYNNNYDQGRVKSSFPFLTVPDWMVPVVICDFFCFTLFSEPIKL